jgi:hypothetical protein
VDREHTIERDELTLDELDTFEVIELPERELMTGCGGGGIFIGASLCLDANVGVGLGCTSITAGANVAAGAGLHV